MPTVLAFPPLDQIAGTAVAAAKPTGNLAELSIKAAAIAHLRAQEPALLALAERYRNVALDLTTSKGLAAGKAARMDLRENGRYAIQRGRDMIKDLLNTAKKDADDEAERLIEIVRPVEADIHGQVEAREKQLADEKAERDRIAAERAASFKAKIDAIQACVGKCQGLPSDRIAAGIAKVEAIVIDAAAWEEFTEEASQAKVMTLAAMLSLRDAAKAREDEAARVEAQRIENARVAAEQAAEAKRLKDAAEALAAQAAALAAHQKVLDDAREEAERKEREKVEAEASSQREAKEKAAAAIAAAQAPAPVPAKPAIVIELEESAPFELPAPPPIPTLSLGIIKERLGFVVTAEFLAGLGFTATTIKAAKLYQDSDWPAICDAICKHVLAAKTRELEATL